MKKDILFWKCLLLMMVVAVGCTSPEPSTQVFTLANWLSGTWENVGKSGTLIEHWEQQDDSTYTGFSYYIMGNDTVSSELLRMEQHNQTLLYIPTVEGQNDNQPVVFTSTLLSDSMLVFENKEHDFPQKISYRKINTDSVVAEISGTLEGVYKTIPYPMKRATEQGFATVR